MMSEASHHATDNLGGRQRALNARVNEAAATNILFEDVRNTEDKSDIDKLFKIDLASKYKHTVYIIEVLKSGDSLYITRAIKKCPWIFDEHHTDKINPTNLHNNVFPFMAIKMKKKFLTAVSMHVRNEIRATEFYKYCMENDLFNNGFKFLLFTANDIKKDLLLNRNHPYFKDLMKRDADYMKHLIGNSFILLEAYLDALPGEKKYNFVSDSRHMYLINCDKYLELLEKYAKNEDDEDCFDFRFHRPKFNVKFSRNIMIKHKERVCANPRFYVQRLDNKTFMKYITVDDAKSIAVAFLPKTSTEFWDNFYYNRHKVFLKFIPHEELYAFLKKIYNNQYPNEEFEMSPGFYNQDIHLFMTTQEREDWAIQHLKAEKANEGPFQNTYEWYEFINFETSFKAIKQMLEVTTDPYTRNGMMKTVVRSAKNNRELEIVLTYYYENHKDTRELRNGFLHNVIFEKNVFEFDEDCWTAFYKILLSMELYNTKDFPLNNNIYKTVTLLYYILNKKDINDGLEEFLLVHFSYHMINKNDFGHYNKLSDEKRKIVYEYLFKYYVNKVSDSKDDLYTIELSTRFKRYFNNITGLMRLFKEEVIEKEPAKNESSRCKKIRQTINCLSDRELIRRLKKDTKLVTSDYFLEKIKSKFEIYPVRLNNFMNKLRIYFRDDVASMYLNIFKDFICKDVENVKSAELGVFAIFTLGDEKMRTDLMDRYALQELNTEPNQIKLLEVKKAICRFVCYARPLVPLSLLEKYISGDYTNFYRHVIKMYLANVPTPLCLQLLEIIKTKSQHSYIIHIHG